MSGDGSVVDVARARDLLDRFLAERGDRTRRAYSIDIEEFASFLDQPAAGAIARLLRGGPAAARRLVLEHAVDMRRRGRARQTVERRMGTLRTLVHAAHRAGLAGWSLAVPTEEEVLAAVAAHAASASYVFPRHPAEIHRLDVQHYAMREALGTNHVAPVHRPLAILDAGCGTGQWGFEMCAQFPGARVFGLDLVPGKPAPSGYRFVRGNLLQGLPFRDGRFDLVHQRFLAPGVPVPSWPAVVAELARTGRPGGWVELVEMRMELQLAGPATRRLFGMAMGMQASLGLDASGVVADSLDGYLRQAGLTNVARRELVLPIGQWGGRTGALMVTDVRSAFTRACEVLHSRALLSLEEGMDLIQRLSVEVERHQTTVTCVIAMGQRPSKRGRR
jgi:SAM-dependent methyltransferase